MQKRILSLMVIIALCFLSLQTAMAATEKADYPTAYADRPLIVSAGMGELGLDLGLGMNKDRALKDLGVNLSFGYGIMPSLELGVDIFAVNYGKDLQGMKFGGAAVYVEYELYDFMALYFDIHFPGTGDFVDSFGDQLLGVTLGAEFTYTIIDHMFEVHGGLGLDVGFAKEAIAGKSPQMTLMLAYGVAYNPMEMLYIDLTANTNLAIRPDDGVFIPLALTVGLTPMNALDVYLSFVLADVKGTEFDARAIVLGANYRF